MSDQDSMAEPGMVLDERYELVEEIARGGFGLVFRAEQLNMNREVAIKMVPPDFMDLPDVVQRFEREARLASRLSHPNTITVHDYGKHEDHLFLVMELLEGEDLADVLSRERSVSLDRIARIAKQILKSLNEAHEQGIIHRDLKPENIFLSEISGETDFVKVVDFGIAKLAMPEMNQEAAPDENLTIEGNTVGTPTYMSPEQAAGGDVDARSDLYALGVMMYEMAAGEPPFDEDEPAKLMRQHIFQDIPAFPDRKLRESWVRPVVRRAMAKEKEARYQDADAFIDAIDYAIEAADDDRAFAPTQEQETVDDETDEDLQEDSLELVDEGAPDERLADTGPTTRDRARSVNADTEQPAVRAPSTDQNTGSSVMTVLERSSDDDVIVLDEPKESPEEGDSTEGDPASDEGDAADRPEQGAKMRNDSAAAGVGAADSSPVPTRSTDSNPAARRRTPRDDAAAAGADGSGERESWEWSGTFESHEFDDDGEVEYEPADETSWVTVAVGLVVLASFAVGLYVFLYGVPPSLAGS